MSQFYKKLLIFFGAFLAIYFLTCTSFLPDYETNDTINHDVLVTNVSAELEYEMIYGDSTIDYNSFIDKAIQAQLRNN